MQNKRLFVGGLLHTTDDARLKEYYSTWGVVEAAVVVKNESGNSRCFGFVTFSDPGAAIAACKEKPHEIDGKVVDAKPAVSKYQSGSNDPTPVKKLFVGGVNRNVDESQLSEYFSSFGPVVEAIIMRDRETGTSRGFGFITFEDESVVENIIASSPHTVGSYPIDVKKALPKKGPGNFSRNGDSGYPSYPSYPMGQQQASGNGGGYYQQGGYGAAQVPNAGGYTNDYYANYYAAAAAAGAGGQTAAPTDPSAVMGSYPGQAYYGGPMRDQQNARPPAHPYYDGVYRQ